MSFFLFFLIFSEPDALQLWNLHFWKWQKYSFPMTPKSRRSKKIYYLNCCSENICHRVKSEVFEMSLKWISIAKFKFFLFTHIFWTWHATVMQFTFLKMGESQRSNDIRFKKIKHGLLLQIALRKWSDSCFDLCFGAFRDN